MPAAFLARSPTHGLQAKLLADPAAQLGQKFIIEPWVFSLPRGGPPAGMRQRQAARQGASPIPDGLGDRRSARLSEVMVLSIPADQENEAQVRQHRHDPGVP